MTVLKTKIGEPFLLIDYIGLMKTPNRSYEEMTELTTKLKEIAREKNIPIVTASTRDEYLEYCKNDLENQLSFSDSIHNLRRIERRRQKGHVSRRKRDLQPKQRKRYLGKSRMPKAKAIQLLEQDNVLNVSVVKERSRPEGMGVRFNPRAGFDLRTIQAFHER